MSNNSNDRIPLAIIKYLQDCLEQQPHLDSTLTVAIQCIRSAFHLPDDDAIIYSRSDIPDLMTLQHSSPDTDTENDSDTETDIEYEEDETNSGDSDSNDQYKEPSTEDINKAEQLKSKGNEALSAGNLDEAIKCYTEAIHFNPNNAIYWCNRSAAHLSRKPMADTKAALADALEAKRLDSKYAKAYTRAASALQAMNKPNEALKLLRQYPGISDANDSQEEQDEKQEQQFRDPQLKVFW